MDKEIIDSLTKTIFNIDRTWMKANIFKAHFKLYLSIDKNSPEEECISTHMFFMESWYGLLYEMGDVYYKQHLDKYYPNAELDRLWKLLKPMLFNMRNLAFHCDRVYFNSNPKLTKVLQAWGTTVSAKDVHDFHSELGKHLLVMIDIRSQTE